MEPPVFDLKRAQIAACRGVYGRNATARHFGVSTTYVDTVWNGPEQPEVEPPNIWGARPIPGLLDKDVVILHLRGLTNDQIAKELGMTTTWVKWRKTAIRNSGVELP